MNALFTRINASSFRVSNHKTHFGEKMFSYIATFPFSLEIVSTVNPIKHVLFFPGHKSYIKEVALCPMN